MVSFGYFETSFFLQKTRKDSVTQTVKFFPTEKGERTPSHMRVIMVGYPLLHTVKHALLRTIGRMLNQLIPRDIM